MVYFVQEHANSTRTAGSAQHRTSIVSDEEDSVDEPRSRKSSLTASSNGDATSESAPSPASTPRRLDTSTPPPSANRTPAAATPNKPGQFREALAAISEPPTSAEPAADVPPAGVTSPGLSSSRRGKEKAVAKSTLSPSVSESHRNSRGSRSIAVRTHRARKDDTEGASSGDL
jgi:hypothetical protein